jgi:quercetin dioxygenase-like cupin family protein
MSAPFLGRRSFVESLLAVPAGLAAKAQPVAPGAAGTKVPAGDGRAGERLMLPGGNPLFIRVTTEDSQGAFFMSEQPISRRGMGPPKHYHEAQDEWFYCLEGEFVVEVGDQRFRLRAGESVLAARRVPHAFVYDFPTPGRLLVGFTPALTIERFFRDLAKRGAYFGSGTAEDRETARREFGIVNVGPPLKL